MRDGDADSLSQDEIIKRLTALLLQIGNVPRSTMQPQSMAIPDLPPIITDSDVDWRNGVLYGVCMSAAVAAGAGLNGPTPISELAASGLSLARYVQYQWMED